MVQRILQLKQENVNLFGWEIRDILKAEQAQAKSAIKNGTNCLKSKHLMMTSIPSISSINRILRSSDNRSTNSISGYNERKMMNSSNNFPTSNNDPVRNNNALHSNALNNSLINHHNQSINHATSSLQNGSSLNNSTNSPYNPFVPVSQSNGRNKNLINLNTLNLVNTIKQQEQQAKLRNENKNFLSSSNIQKLYNSIHPHQNGLNPHLTTTPSNNSSSLNEPSLNNTLSLNTPLSNTPTLSTSVQNLLQMSSSQLLMVNQQSIDQTNSIDHLTANQAFQQLACNYLNANLNAVVSTTNNFVHQTNLNQTLNQTNLDHAAFLLNQMQQHRILNSSSSSLPSTPSCPSNSINSTANNLNNQLNNKQLINSVNNLINESTSKQVSSIQEPLTLSTLVNNLNSPNTFSNNPQLTSAMNNLLLTTKPNMFTQLLQQTSILQDGGQMLNSLANGSMMINETSPTRQSKKYSSYNIADILMISEYNNRTDLKNEIKQTNFKQPETDKIDDKLFINPIKSNQMLNKKNDEKKIKDEIVIKTESIDAEDKEDDVKVNILD